MTTPLTRVSGPTSQGLYYSFEKAGLTLDRQPIPWNAEAVTIEAVVRAVVLSSEGLRDFGLHLPGWPRIAAETFRAGLPGVMHVFFRIAVPPETMPAEVRWRDRSLGQINLPLLTREQFLAGLTITEPTVHVRLQDEAYACQAYVAAQAKELIASMMLTSPTSLAPLADLELGASIVSDDQLVARRVVWLESNQLKGKLALVAVPFAKPKAAIREWEICWTIGEQNRATRTIRGYPPSEFHRSLRISTTRLILRGEAGDLPLARFAPASWDGIKRLGPVFLVSSGIVGMAARAEFHVRVLDRGRNVMLEMPPVTTLVTDSPTPIAPGTLGRDDAIESFELWCGTRRLGEMTLSVAPSAVFTGEGGIAASRDDFAWLREAEEQLQHKLGQLLGGG